VGSKGLTVEADVFPLTVSVTLGALHQLLCLPCPVLVWSSLADVARDIRLLLARALSMEAVSLQACQGH